MVEVTDKDGLHHVLEDVFDSTIVDCGRPAGRLIVNRVAFSGIDLRFSSSTFALTTDHRPRDAHCFVFMAYGSSAFAFGEDQVVLTDTAPGVYLNPDRPFRTVDGAQAALMSLRLVPERLDSIARDLLGDDVARVRFLQPQADDISFHNDLRAALFTMARDIDRVPEPYRPRFFREFEDIVVTKVLLHAPNDAFRSALPALSSPLRRVEEYMHSHFGQAITLSVLAKVAGQSGRTVVRSFLQAHGVTPQAYLRRLRLGKARHTIIQRPDLPIMQIGLMCGFNSLGFFARTYKAYYDELPSETRRRSIGQ